MKGFHISSPATGGLRFKDVSVDTSITGGVASARVTTEKGVTNPAYILSMGHIGSPDLLSRTKTKVVEGTGSSPLDDAVSSLHELGERHGVTGISLSTNPSLTGSVMFADQPGMFQSGGPTTARVGRENLRAIDDAARLVLGIATTTD